MPKLLGEPYWATTDGETVKLYQGDVLDVLRDLPSRSVQCVITSPPYWGLRDYGTGEWQGGKKDCDHVNQDSLDERRRQIKSMRDLGERIDGSTRTRIHDEKIGQSCQYKNLCKKCGAKRIDAQLGSEERHCCNGWARGENCAEKDWATACHVCRMVVVFREIRRVLRDDGTLWLNYGDSYSSGGRGGGSDNSKQQTNRGSLLGPKSTPDLPSGNLCGVPWRVALALQADSWILRSDIPWLKRSSMPESVVNRPAKSLEYVFLFVKKMGYYFDMEAVKKSGKPSSVRSNAKDRNSDSRKDGTLASGTRTGTNLCNAYSGVDFSEVGRNFRNADLWFESISPPHGMVGVGDDLVGMDVTSQGYPGAHFATFGERLITPFILAGTSERGACAKCGAPWRRVVSTEKLTRNRPRDFVKRNGTPGTGNVCANSVAGVSVKTLGWQPGCECHGKFVKKVVEVERPISLGRIEGDGSAGNHDRSKPQNRNGKTGSLDGRVREMEKVKETVLEYVPKIPLEKHPIKPCVILDPFCGSATTCAVAVEHERHSIGIDLSEKYLKSNAIPRIEGVILQRPELVGLVSKPGKRLDDGDDC